MAHRIFNALVDALIDWDLGLTAGTKAKWKRPSLVSRLWR
jgi:hypothetical protein